MTTDLDHQLSTHFIFSTNVIRTAYCIKTVCNQLEAHLLQRVEDISPPVFAHEVTFTPLAT